MDVRADLRGARKRAGLTQAELARRARTSQATISAYEAGRKQPSVATLSRLLAVAGARLTVEHSAPLAVEPSAGRHARNARTLLAVLALAEALPTRHERELLFPRLPLAS